MKNLKFKNIIITLSLISSLLIPNYSFADETSFDPKLECLITMNNGEIISANILEQKSGQIIIYTKILGQITIEAKNVKEIKFINNEKPKTEPEKINTTTVLPKVNLEKEWLDNPTDTRLFLAPTARMLKKGKGYFQDIDIFVVTANYGITDNISIGALGSIVPFIGLDKQVFAVMPKFGIEVAKNINVAASVLYVASSTNSIGQFGMGYVAGTYGNSDKNVTLGLGSGLYNGNGRILSSSVVIVGGMYRVGEYISILSENWLIISNGLIVVPSLGIRFFGEKLSADLGVFSFPNLGGSSSFVPIPYIDFVFSF